MAGGDRRLGAMFKSQSPEGLREYILAQILVYGWEGVLALSGLLKNNC